MESRLAYFGSGLTGNIQLTTLRMQCPANFQCIDHVEQDRQHWRFHAEVNVVEPFPDFLPTTKGGWALRFGAHS
jgi:hypothetical protein